MVMSLLLLFLVLLMSPMVGCRRLLTVTDAFYLVADGGNL